MSSQSLFRLDSLLSDSPQSEEGDSEQQATQSTPFDDLKPIVDWLSVPALSTEQRIFSPAAPSASSYTSPPRSLDASSCENQDPSSSPLANCNASKDLPGLWQHRPFGLKEACHTPGRKGKKPIIPLGTPFGQIAASAQTTGPNGGASYQHKKAFHCTFCFKHLKDRYEWKRHESSAHVPATKWICMPHNTAILNGRCVFCDTPLPSLSHTCVHNVERCLAKPLHERTFTREDHLKQHIQQVHLSDRNPRPSQAKQRQSIAGFQVPSSWKLDVDPADFDPNALWCGFCRTDHKTWDERVKHVSLHFQNGEDIASWSPKVP